MSQQTPEITVEAYVARHRDGTTLDVRERMEYAYGHVPGAQLIPMSQVAFRLGEIDRSKPVHVICATGNRSKAVTDFLVAAGFDAVSVAGGTHGWMEAGQPVEVGL